MRLFGRKRRSISLVFVTVVFFVITSVSVKKEYNCINGLKRSSVMINPFLLFQNGVLLSSSLKNTSLSRSLGASGVDALDEWATIDRYLLFIHPLFRMGSMGHGDHRVQQKALSNSTLSMLLTRIREKDKMLAVNISAQLLDPSLSQERWRLLFSDLLLNSSWQESSPTNEDLVKLRQMAVSWKENE